MSCNCDEPIVIKFKKTHPDAVVPTQGHSTDTGYDLVAVDNGVDTFENGVYVYTEYDTGIIVEPPAGYHTEIVPRSSLTKKNLMLKNSVGIIDNTFRGALKCRFQKTDKTGTTNVYKKGDKMAQLIVRKTYYATFEEISNTSETIRGSGGFGSTGA